MSVSEKAMIAAELAEDPRYGLRQAAEERKREGGDIGREGRYGLACTQLSTSYRAPDVAAQAAAMVGVSRGSTLRAITVKKHGTDKV